jgi:hypothetical protein
MSSARAAVVIFLMGLTGCIPRYSGPATTPPPPTLPQAAADATERLMTTAGVVTPHATILVSTIADLTSPLVCAPDWHGGPSDCFEDKTRDGAEASNFGRLVSDEIAGRLIQMGYTVPEIRLTRQMMFRAGGEFMLSSRARDLMLKNQNANLVVVGTYSPMGARTYVNLKLVRLADGIPVSAVDFSGQRLIHDY